MRITKQAGNTVLVMSEGGGQCPRMIISSKATRMKDDYKGSLKSSSKLLRKIVSLG